MSTYTQELQATAKALVAKGNGILANVAAAQKILAHRAACNSAASSGTYSVDSDRQLALVSVELAQAQIR